MKWSDLDRWEKVGMVIVSPAVVLLFVVNLAVTIANKLFTAPLGKLADKGFDAWDKILGGRGDE